MRVHQLRRLIASEIRHDSNSAAPTGIRFAGRRTGGAAVRDETTDNRLNKARRTIERRIQSGPDRTRSMAFMLLR